MLCGGKLGDLVPLWFHCFGCLKDKLPPMVCFVFPFCALVGCCKLFEDQNGLVDCWLDLLPVLPMFCAEGDDVLVQLCGEWLLCVILVLACCCASCPLMEVCWACWVVP